MNRLLDYAPSAGVVVDVGATSRDNVALGRGRRVIGFECLQRIQELLPVMAPHPKPRWCTPARPTARPSPSSIWPWTPRASSRTTSPRAGAAEGRVPNDTEPALLIPLGPILSEAPVAGEGRRAGERVRGAAGRCWTSSRDLPAIAYEDAALREARRRRELLRGLGYNCVLIGDQLSATRARHF